ncbi:DUF1178 family protein [Bosea sp. 124]|uniref:DUF1178 family protein n=1 Tax=Bosea sp. 124 TaxID=2135642 RepID=UPI000D3A57E9|nr:DUF1178 family protein [Bosea sp. 124]PTM41101.1 hypothetical protein C8D03_2634 [Bosea sp. 124]
MIRYALVCDSAHEFESWFAGSASFEDQLRRGLVTCPLCDSKRVDRAIMAPNVARTDRGARAIEVEQEASPAAVPAAPASAAPAALMGEPEIALRQMLTALHKHVAETAEHVGPRFADEALKIHHGESDSRPIYGEATSEDARMLHEEGVAFMPLPRLPGAGN